MTNLEKNKDYLNDFLFQLCLKKYIYIQGEHHYFNKDIKIVFEISSYHNNFLLNNLPFLKTLKIVECKFDLNKFKFDEKEIFSDEQIVGLGFKHNIMDNSYEILDYAEFITKNKINVKELCNRFHTIYQLKR